MSVNKILDLAKTHGVQLDAEQAEAVMNRMDNGELSDSELEAIAGGKDRNIFVFNVRRRRRRPIIIFRRRY